MTCKEVPTNNGGSCAMSFNFWLSFTSRVGHAPGGGGTPYKALYGKAPPERGTFFRFQVYERVRIFLFEVYERLGKSVIWVYERAQKG